MKKRRVGIFRTGLVVWLALATAASAQSAQIPGGLNYLSTTQNPDGSWPGESFAGGVPTTIAAVESLSILGQESTQGYANAISWLKGQDFSSTDYLSKRIHALMVAGADVGLLLSYADETLGAWGGYDDYQVNTLDTALALQALKVVGYPDQDLLGSAVGYLLSTQNADGGWGFYQGDASNVYMTAVVSSILQQFPRTTSVATAINKATAYLKAHQNPDGGFGGSPSTVYETALTYLALVDVTTDATVLGNAIAYLTSTQLPNGSWNDDPYSTALALRALGSFKPNLSIVSGDISVSNPAPTVGDTITINATVRNTGPQEAQSVAVRFFDGNPVSGGLLIGETTIPLIPSFGSGAASSAWTIPSASSFKVYVIVDPLNVIAELSETDNVAVRGLTAAALPDLSISSADVLFLPSTPMPGDPVTITATVRNKGETGASGVTVDLYDGAPGAGGVHLGQALIPSIAPGGSEAVSFAASFAAGSHTIHAVVDGANTVAEANEANNAAVKTLNVGGGFVDLSVMKNWVYWEPIYPTAGYPIPITAVVSNLGEAEAKNVRVRIYLGDPAAGGTQIGTDVVIPAIAAGGTAKATVIWDSTGRQGKNFIYTVADPLDEIVEANEFNNKAFVTIDVAASTGTNVMVADGEITFSPASPVSGDVVTISALIRNNGSAIAKNILVEFSVGDPKVPGTKIIGSQVIPELSSGIYDKAVVQIPWNTAGLSGPQEIYVSVDPMNEIPEVDEGDNIAHATVVVQAKQGPDLAVSAIDVATLSTDTQTLEVSGSIAVTLENKGSQDALSAFTVAAFEDRNGNKILDPGIDNVLGEVPYAGVLASGASGTVSVPVSGKVLFRGNLIYVTADSGNAVEEADETNNTRSTGQECGGTPKCRTYDVVEKFYWVGDWVYSVPLVASLTDDNGDQKIDGNDIPDIIFSTGIAGSGPIRAISGDDGHELFKVANGAHFVDGYTHLAVGDIDGDGLVEIIGLSSQKKALLAFNRDGTLKWISEPISLPLGLIERWAVSIADLDGDGKPEIISGPNVLNNDGTVRWSKNINDGIPVVADLDMDGVPEILLGNSAYRADGSLYWTTSLITTQKVAHAVANLDDDPFPEVIQVISSQYNVFVYAFEHDGTPKWGPVKINSLGFEAAPTIADFDGDGKPEIGVSAMNRYTVIKRNGTILWQSVLYDGTWGGLSAAAFDFDGDGAVEIVHNDMQYLRIFSGRTGETLFATPNSTATVYDAPIVADVDGDGHAEIIAPANYGYTYNYHGIRVFQNACDAWGPTRKIWNEYNYHITNVNDDGTIPSKETPNWTIYNNYRENPLLSGAVKTDLTASSITVAQSNFPASVTVSARIGNGSSGGQVPGVDAAFYDGDPAQGGILLGRTKTMRNLGSGEFEDVSVVWIAPSSGSHNVHVIVDEGNTVAECREDNNSAVAMLTIGGAQPPTDNLPDLGVSASDVTLLTPAPVEGQPAVVAAVVRNLGTVTASDATVSFYDGDPQIGGLLIGSVTLPSITPGATALAQISWDTFGQSGRNYIHVVVDPGNAIAESNEDNNSTLFPIDVTLPSKPDLLVTSTDITFSSPSPKEGDPLVVTAVIHNMGLPASDVEAALYDGDPKAGGVLLSQKALFQVIPSGGTAAVEFAVDTLGLPGNHAFYVSVDPSNRIDETSEANNQAWKSLTISQAGLALSLITDKTQYTAAEDARITLNLANLLTSSRPGAIEVKIVDAGEILVSTAAAGQPLTLAPSETRSMDFVWNTGQTLSGNYKAVGFFTEGGSVTARAEALFAIVPVKSVSSKVAADKISYGANEQVALASTIQSASPNHILANLTARVAITSPQGITLFTESMPLFILTPGQVASFNTYWNTAAHPEGTYAATLEVLEGAAVLSASSTTFKILGSTQTGAGLLGSLAASPNPVYQGQTLTLPFGVTNKGNQDFASLTATVLIVNPDTQEVKNTFQATLSLLLGDTQMGEFVTQTTHLAPRTYLAILQVVTPAMVSHRTLASTAFEVKPGIEASKRIPDVSNLLVWVNEKCEEHHGHEGKHEGKKDDEPCVRLDLLEGILKQAATTYRLVFDKKDFQAELRNPYYTDVLILGNHHPLEDHFADELRERVYSGKGLVSSLYLGHGEGHEHEKGDQDLNLLFGLSYKGQLSGDEHPVTLLDSPLSQAATVAAKGKALRVEVSDPARIAAWLTDDHHHKDDKQSPGIVLNGYGLGKTVFFAFDLGASLSEEAQTTLKTLIRNSVSYVHRAKDTTAFHPFDLAPVEITLKSLGAAFDLRLTETYPDGIRIYDPVTGTWITDNPWTVNIHLEPNETRRVLYYALLPDRAGTYTLGTQVAYLEGGVYTPYQELHLDLIAAQDSTTLAGDVIQTLKALPAAGEDQERVNEAIKYLEKVQARAVATREDAEKNIHDILKAIDKLLPVASADVSSVRLMLDELLKVWEGWWCYAL